MPDGGISEGLMAGLTAGSGLIGAGTSLFGSKQASNAASDAAKLQQQQYETTRADLLPYNQAGQSVLGDLSNLARSGPTGGGPNYLAMAQGNLPGTMTQQQLEQTPGYQFALSQGLRAAQNTAAARGLGVSGAAMKGAATFATGLADQTYQNQFANQQAKFGDILNLNTGQQSNLNNQFSHLSGVATLGEDAAAKTGVQGTLAAASSGNYLNQAGQQQAAGYAGVGNALNSAAQNYLGYTALQQQLGNTGTTGGYGANLGPVSNVNNAPATYNAPQTWQTTGTG